MLTAWLLEAVAWELAEAFSAGLLEAAQPSGAAQCRAHNGKQSAMLSKKACYAPQTASSSIHRPHMLPALPRQACQGYSGLKCSQHCLIKHAIHTQDSGALSTASSSIPRILRPPVLSALPHKTITGLMCSQRCLFKHPRVTRPEHTTCALGGASSSSQESPDQDIPWHCGQHRQTHLPHARLPGRRAASLNSTGAAVMPCSSPWRCQPNQSLSTAHQPSAQTTQQV